MLENFTYWVFDFEVMKYGWTSQWYNPLTQEWRTIRNDRAALIDFMNEYMRKAIFVGFNSTRYDVNIIKAIYGGLNPYELSQWIIQEGKTAYMFPGLKAVYGLPILSFDLKNDAIKRYNMALSLKEYEAYIGRNIHESSIPFDLDRMPTEEEWRELEAYCADDVLNATRLFDEPTQINQLETLMALCSLIDEPLYKNLHRTVAQLAAKVLGTAKVRFEDAHIYELPEEIDVKNQEVLDFFTKAPLDPNQKLTVNAYGIEFEFGLGGMHAAPSKYVKTGRFLNMDVTSFYPSMIIQYGYYPRGIKDPEKYVQIYNDRVKYKREGKKIMADAYKLVLNIVYGAADNEYSELFDPRMRRAISITGQLLLWDLIEKLAPYGEFVNVNTDGLMIKPHEGVKDETIMAICDEWQKRSRMGLEFDWYKKVIQADVNNYILVTEDDHIKFKGAMVKFYKTEKSNYKRHLRILDDAVVDFFVNGVNPRETITNCKDILDLMYIAKASGLYMKIFSGPTDQIEAAAKGNPHGLPLDKIKEEQRVSRLFPTTNENGVTLRKWRTVSKNETEEKEQFTKFTSAPDRSYIIDGDITGYNTPEKAEAFLKAIDIDWEYYIKEAWGNIEKMTGPDMVKYLKEAYGEK